jgi:hypothetical protein
MGKIILMAGAVVMLALPAMAANGKGPAYRPGTGKGTQDRLRDGSCRDAIEQRTDGQRFAAGKLQDMLQLLLKDKVQDQEYLHDGSCQG